MKFIASNYLASQWRLHEKHQWVIDPPNKKMLHLSMSNRATSISSFNEYFSILVCMTLRLHNTIATHCKKKYAENLY